MATERVETLTIGENVDVLDLPAFEDAVLDSTTRRGRTSPRTIGRKATGTSWLYEPAKRMTDIVVSAVLLVLLSPPLLLIAAAIKLYDRGPILFVQTRVGRNGRHFPFYKFRTMVPNADELKPLLEEQNRFRDDVTFKLIDDPRITPVGYVLRKTSLDELPQLWNVLVGQMTLVGPRPPVPNEVKKYTPHQARRLTVTPGLTCIWQVSGRSDLPFERQIEMDLQYIDNRSLRFDFVLMVRTIPAILLMRGAY